MKLKITGRNKDNFDKNLTDFLNVATMICLQGTIPTEYYIKEAKNLGYWWFRENDSRFELLKAINNHKLIIRNEGENFIIVEFNIRYDYDGKKKTTISELMLAWFDFVEHIN